VDEALDFLRKARAATNAHVWYIHFWLAAALGLKGDLDQAKAALAEFLELKPQWNSLARLRAAFPAAYGNPQYAALAEKTVDLGLRRAGLPEE
jgi:adenylate cyclase